MGTTGGRRSMSRARVGMTYQPGYVTKFCGTTTIAVHDAGLATASVSTTLRPAMKAAQMTRTTSSRSATPAMTLSNSKASSRDGSSAIGARSRGLGRWSQLRGNAGQIPTGARWSMAESSGSSSGPQNGPQEANGDERTTPDSGGDCRHGVGAGADAPAVAEEE